MKLSDRKFFASQALYGLMLTSKTQPQILAPEARLAMCQAAYDWADDMEKIGQAGEAKETADFFTKTRPLESIQIGGGGSYLGDPLPAQSAMGSK